MNKETELKEKLHRSQQRIADWHALRDHCSLGTGYVDLQLKWEDLRIAKIQADLEKLDQNNCKK
tara:strand:+ start:298 stop:489 length:192 start_codon:yes stop_codon:yes gene_type:complete